LAPHFAQRFEQAGPCRAGAGGRDPPASWRRLRPAPTDGAPAATVTSWGVHGGIPTGSAMWPPRRRPQAEPRPRSSPPRTRLSRLARRGPRRTGCTDHRFAHFRPCGGTVSGRRVGCVPPQQTGPQPPATCKNAAKARGGIHPAIGTRSPRRDPTENAGGRIPETRRFAGKRVAVSPVRHPARTGPDEQGIGNEHRVECPRESAGPGPPHRRKRLDGRPARPAAGPEKAGPTAARPDTTNAPRNSARPRRRTPATEGRSRGWELPSWSRIAFNAASEVPGPRARAQGAHAHAVAAGPRARAASTVIRDHVVPPVEQRRRRRPSRLQEGHPRAAGWPPQRERKPPPRVGAGRFP